MNFFVNSVKIQIFQHTDCIEYDVGTSKNVIPSKTQFPKFGPLKNVFSIIDGK